MKHISSYSTVNLAETIELIDHLAIDLTRTPKDVEDFTPDQVTYVDRMNSDVAQFNNGVLHLKCALIRELLKDEDDE